MTAPEADAGGTCALDGQSVLVTGATGFTGGALARTLAARGARVSTLARDGRDTSALEADGIAVHRGDLRTFERELDTHQQRFIQHGSYLLVERAKTIAYRNFFKRVHSLHDEGTTKLDIAMFKRCLDAMGVRMDKEEVECVLANLIYKGYIKGYLSHQHSKLVVSKTNSFPPLRDVLGGE